MKKIISMALLAMMCGVGQVAKAQLPKLKDTPITAKFGGYVVGDYSYFTYEKENKKAGFNLRYARVYVNGTVAKDFKYRLQAEMAGAPGVDEGPRVIDAYTEWVKYSWLNVRFGQMKRVFTFENPYNPWTVGFGSNAQVISKLSGYSDISGVSTYSGGRDVGVMIYGNVFKFERNGKEIPILTYKLGVFNGNGMNKKDANLAKDIAGSVEVCPGVEGLMLAASYYGGNYYLSAANKDNANRDRFTVGGKYENGRLTVRSEYIIGTTEMAEGAETYNLNSDGFYVTGGYWFNIKNQRIRPVARYDFFRQNIDTPETNSTYYMVGVDWWPYKNLRLLVNYTMKDKPGFDYMGNLWQAQLSVKF